MSVIRHYLFVAATGFALVVLGACTRDPSGAMLLAQPTERVCQLTADTDWLTGAATTSQSATRFGFLGTDLGYPVEHDNSMVLFFGDSRFSPRQVTSQPDLPNTGPESVPPDDAIGWVTTWSPPTPSRCLDLTINHERNNSHVAVSPVVGPPSIKQGLFNVPSGGVSIDGVLYGFFWTDHCLNRNTCPNFGTLNEIGRGVLARYRQSDMKFVEPVRLPNDFVYTTAVDTSGLVGIPKEQRLGILVFGVPAYRRSVPYLAYAPSHTLADPTSWKFFVGRGTDGQPTWMDYGPWMLRKLATPAPGRPDLFDANKEGRCVGEFSITWNHPLGIWLMLYNCADPDAPPKTAKILARVATAPWGPWSQPTVVLDPESDNGACQLFWKVPGKGNGCDDRLDDWRDENPGKIDGGFYAPFVMERYTTRVRTTVPLRKQAIVFWLLSTYNPYQVTVMKTMLTVERFPTSVSVSSNEPSVTRP